MFGWIRAIFGRTDAAKIAQLQREIEAKAVGSGWTGGPIGNPLFDTSSLTTSKEALSHFSGWVFACVRLISQRIAGQAIVVSKKPKRKIGVKSHGEELENHPLSIALRDPNELMVSSQLVQFTVANLELAGLAFWLIDQQPERLFLWPIPSSWVRPIHDDLLYARYEIRPARNSEPFTVDGANMVRFAYADPSDPLKTVSPLQAAARPALADVAIQTAQHSSFKNGIFPGLALIAGRLPEEDVPDVSSTGSQSDERPILTKVQRQTLISAIKNAYRGAHRADEPLILDGLIRDIKKVTNTAREMDFLSSGKSTKARILQIFGVNPILLGEVEGANRASAATADSIFIGNTVNPKIRMLSECLTSWFSAYFNDPALSVWIPPAKARDEEARRAELDLLAKHESITKNELRGALGFAETPDGDVLISRSGRAKGVTVSDRPFWENDEDPRVSIPMVEATRNGRTGLSKSS